MVYSRAIDFAFQTMYSEIVQRSLDDAFASEFSPSGRFVAVEIKGKKYWYFDMPKAGGGQLRRYVGPADDAEIGRRVASFKDLKADVKARRKLVSALTREAHLPRPPAIAGDVVEALGSAGFFRLRGVLVGTIAYQCYPAILGRRLDAAAMQTGDADFAQFYDISVAVNDSMPPILEVLRAIDSTFREIASPMDGRLSTQFVSRDRFKVEFLTPNRGGADFEGKPVQMPALGGAAAFPLRFLDYLIHLPVRAVLLHKAGVPVLIPAPERFAVHKLIVASRRHADGDPSAKSRKDRLQARAILDAMLDNSQHAEIAAAYVEAWQRGDAWKQAIRSSLVTYDDAFRERLRSELAAAMTELGVAPTDVGLDERTN